MDPVGRNLLWNIGFIAHCYTYHKTPIWWFRVMRCFQQLPGVGDLQRLRCEPVEVWDDHTSHNLLMAAIKRQHNHNKHQGMLQNLLPRIYHLGFNCWNLRLNKCLTKYLPSSTCASPILNTQPGIQLVYIYIYISPFQSSKLHPFVWRKWLGITRNCQGYFFDRVLSLPF